MLEPKKKVKLLNQTRGRKKVKTAKKRQMYTVLYSDVDPEPRGSALWKTTWIQNGIQKVNIAENLS